MDYSLISSIKHKIEMALFDWKGKGQKCLACGTVREPMPSSIKLDVNNAGEIVVDFVGSVYNETNWTELYAEAYDGAPSVGAICRDCAVRREIVKEPEAIPVPVPTTPAEMAVVPASAPKPEEEIPF